jgi:translation initiation factor IF-3
MPAAAVHGKLTPPDRRRRATSAHAERGPARPLEDSPIRPQRFDRSMPRDTGPRVNDRITIRFVRLIDAEGNNVGEVPTEEALRMAQDAGLDLVEVNAKSRPPVCRIMDFGRYKYEQNKKAHESKQKQHRSKLKTVRLRPKTDPHMLEIRVAMAREFLERGDKVQLMILFRGREMVHQELGIAHCNEVAKRLEDIAKVEQPPRMEGRRMSMMLGRK